MTAIAFSADAGEGADDAALAPFLTTLHVACGGHAGDAETMAAAVRLAQRHGLALGAHPAYPDRARFGREVLELPLTTLAIEIERQCAALVRIAVEAGLAVTELKPHGALYHRAATDRATAECVLRCAQALGARCRVVTQTGSELWRAAVEKGVPAAAEAFVDRRYRADGTLVPRGVSGALIEDAAEAVRQVLSIVRDGTVIADDGSTVRVTAQSLCIHSDTPGAAAIAAAVRRALDVAGISVGAAG